MMKILIFITLFGFVTSSEILSYDRNVYVLISVTNSTPINEVIDLINFYLKIQVSCLECVPPINNLPCEMFFGSYRENFLQFPNTTEQIEQIVNSPLFAENLYNKTLTTDFIDIKWFLSLTSKTIELVQQTAKGRLKKKQIVILTNYYFPQISQLLQNIVLPDMNTTFVSFFTLNSSFLPISDIKNSILPMQIFDKSDAKFDFAKASQEYLNLFIDYNYKTKSAPVKIFMKLSGDNLQLAMNFPYNILNTGLCKLNNESEYYQISLLLTFGTYQSELTLHIPNLKDFTWTYFDFIFPLVLNTTENNFSSVDSCQQNLYNHLTDSLAENKSFEQFNFYITDNFPNCMVSTLTKNGTIVTSFKNHFDVFLHSINNQKFDPINVYTNVTMPLLSTANASEKASHVYFGDFTNASFFEIFGICAEKTKVFELLPVQQNILHKDPSPWPILFGIFGGILFLGFGIMMILVKISKNGRIKLMTRRITRASSTNAPARNRIAEQIISATNLVTEVIQKGPILYRNWQIINSELAIDYTDVLGKGSSATIYRGFLNGKAPLTQLLPRLETQQFQKCAVAVKICLNHNFRNSEQINNEIRSIICIGYHPNLCAFLGWAMAKEMPCLVFELVDCDLLKWSKNFRETTNMPSTKEMYGIFWQIANGMAHIASKKLVHRDLAARNVLLTTDLRIKITDFGLCCSCDQSDTYAGSVTKRLPIKWLSPEAILDRIFSEKSDIWSFGVVIFEVVNCGITPYATFSNEEMLEFIQAGKRLETPNDTPEALTKIMQKCWKSNPDDRPNFAQLRNNFTTLLEAETNYYGYLAHLAWTDNQKSPGINSFIGFDFEKRPSRISNLIMANQNDIEIDLK